MYAINAGKIPSMKLPEIRRFEQSLVTIMTEIVFWVILVRYTKRA